MAVIGPAAFDGARWRLRVAALLVLLVSLFGVFVVDFLNGERISQPMPGVRNMFFRLYALHEAPFLWMLAAFAVGMWFATRASVAPVSPTRSRLVAGELAVPAMLAAAAVLAVTLCGTIWVMHQTPLAMDEYAATFQAKILATGRLAAPVPEEWRPFANALVPGFISYRATENVWLSTYLPGYAALRAIFSVMRIEMLVNPLLAAVSVLALAGASARLWPTDPRRGRVAILYLVTSAQFLLTSMSGYSWAAHLCFNLVWLYLVLREDRLGLATAPWIGVIALGLHNPFPHALFAAPFLLRLLRSRRIGWIAYYGVVYGVGTLAWYRLMSYVHGQVGSGRALEVFGLPSLGAYFAQGMNLSLLLTWQAPAMALFLIAAFFLIRTMKQAERDLMAGLVLTFAFYFLFSENQGHGWGYRYVYSALGNAVLLAASATVTLTAAGGAPLRRLLAYSAVVTLAIQLPLRARQTERFVRPYAATLEFIATRPADVVIVDPNSAYYGRDLIRNDALLKSAPKTLRLTELSPANVEEIVRRYGDRVYLLGVEDMQRLGLPTFGTGPAWRRQPPAPSRP
jgi:hypothetical protein